MGNIQKIFLGNEFSNAGYGLTPNDAVESLCLYLKDDGYKATNIVKYKTIDGTKERFFLSISGYGRYNIIIQRMDDGFGTKAMLRFYGGTEKNSESWIRDETYDFGK